MYICTPPHSISTQISPRAAVLYRLYIIIYRYASFYIAANAEAVYLQTKLLLYYVTIYPAYTPIWTQNYIMLAFMRALESTAIFKDGYFKRTKHIQMIIHPRARRYIIRVKIKYEFRKNTKSQKKSFDDHIIVS